jgi:hypothetical protein
VLRRAVLPAAFFGFISLALEGTGLDGFYHKMKVRAAVGAGHVWEDA